MVISGGIVSATGGRRWVRRCALLVVLAAGVLLGAAGTTVAQSLNVWAWGDDSSGQLGDGVQGYRTTPLQMVGTYNMVSAAAGESHTLLLDSTGWVWACGSSAYGQIGDGTPSSHLTAVKLLGVSNVISIAGGKYRSFAVKSDGKLYGWGQNSYHELGIDSTTPMVAPVASTWMGNVLAVTTGMYHTAALDRFGRVLCWGRSGSGQLGNGLDGGGDQWPVPVQGITGVVVALAAGDNHTVALTMDGRVWAWGSNTTGQLGDGTTTNRWTAVCVPGLSNVVAVAAANRQTVVLKSDGTVWAWGNNSNGQLGDGTITDQHSPVQVSGLSGVVSIMAGAEHMAAAKSDGTVWTWGKNYDGELGNGERMDRHVPVQALSSSGMIGITRVASTNDANHTVVVAGSLYTLSANLVGPGSIAIYPQKTSYQYGEIVCISVTTNTGYFVAGWSGLPGAGGLTSANQALIPILGNTAITATVVADGSVLSWGYNNNGQLGDNSTTERNAPVQVATITGLTGAVAVAGGEFHSLALRPGGTVWAWGDNSSGQLGDGTVTDRWQPVSLAGVSNIVAMSAGAYHSVTLDKFGKVWTWGYNYYGQLGNGNTSDQHSPVQVPGLSGVIAVAAGAFHTLALKSDGTVWAWGQNNSGQLGLNTTDANAHSTPVQVPGLSGIQLIAAGFGHSVAAKSDETIWAWGLNSYGQVGDNTTTLRPAPVKAMNLYGGAISLSAGKYHTVAVQNNGRVWVWGYNGYGQLGDGTTTQRNAPVLLASPILVSTVAAGDYHTVTLDRYGIVMAWGYNHFGQLGDNTTTDRWAAIAPLGYGGAFNLNNVKAIGAGSYGHTLAVVGTTASYAFTPVVAVPGTGTLNLLATTYGYGTCITLVATPGAGYGLARWSGLPAGAVVQGNTATFFMTGDTAVTATFLSSWVCCWGANGNGQLGDTTTTDRPKPDVTLGVGGAGVLTGTVAAAEGGYHSLALKADGTLWAWGFNTYGQLGNGGTAEQHAPVQVSGLGTTKVAAVAAGVQHTVALRADGTVWTWGRNNYGQLGNGTYDGSPAAHSTPFQVLGLSNVVAVAAGEFHTVVLKADGTIWSWGDNGNGQLGDGSTTNRYAPVRVGGLNGMVALAAGAYHTLAVDSDGAVWAWGSNYYGQIALDGTQDEPTPVQVHGLSQIVDVAAGIYHSLALDSEGTVWTWGNNAYGQIGNGNTTDQHEVVTASGLHGAVAVAGGAWHSVALLDDGSVWTWGNNGNGQLGDGTTTTRYTPGPASTVGEVAALATGPTANSTATIAGVMPQYTLTAAANPSAHGTVSANPNLASYAYGTVVQLQASPGFSYNFAGWTASGGIALTPGTTQTALLVTGNATMTANVTFVPTLTITAGTSRNWVYQNAPVSTRDRQVVTVTASVTGDTCGNSGYTMTVTQSGPGVVTPTGGWTKGTLVTPTLNASWGGLAGYLVGGRVNGLVTSVGNLAATGLCKVHVVVTGNVGGSASADVTIVVSPLGDIDDTGQLGANDLAILNNRLNALPIAPQTDADGDLSGDGVVTTADRVLLKKILNGLMVP